jgi:hypothetical protein
MKQFQVVDRRMELALIIGSVFFESDDVEDVLRMTPTLRERHPDTPLVIIDTYRNRQPIG